MIALEEIERQLLELDGFELIYQQLYQKNPQAYGSPVSGWEEFRARFDTPIQENPPTVMKEFLSEQEFFMGAGGPIDSFKNLRYCPAFWHKLEFIKIVYALKGSSVFYINKRKYVMEEGNFCIVSPGVEQAVFTEDADAVALNILLRASTFAHTFSALLSEQGAVSDFFWQLAYTNYNNRVLFFRAEPDQKLKEIALRLFYEVHAEKYSSKLIQESYVCLFLGESFRRYGQELIMLEGLDGNVYQIPEILEYMKEHLEDVTPKELAKKWKRKEKDLRYELKMETGYSFKQLLTDLRLQKAAELLEHTSYSIETVMERTGSSDSAAFYRNFKKRYGITPQIYRQMHRKELYNVQR